MLSSSRGNIAGTSRLFLFGVLTAAALLLSLSAGSGWLLLPISTTSAPPLVTCRNFVREMVRAFFW